MLLTAPKYFNLKETNAGEVLVERGVFKEETISQTYGNRQFLIMDEADGKIKCLSGGALNYIVDLHNLMSGTKVVKIIYDGTEKIAKGKFAGKDSHQFKVELVEDREVNVAKVKEVQDKMEEKSSDSLDDLE